MQSSILSFIAPQLKVNTTKKFIAAIHKILALYPGVAQYILAAYRINQDTPDEEAFPAVLRFANDIAYTAATMTMACGFRDSAFVYCFNEGNPWEGPWKGCANHILDVAYLFQNFHDFMNPREKAISVAFAEDVLKFCHGQVPWPAIAPDADLYNGFFSQIYGASQQGIFTAYYWRNAFGEKTRRRSFLFDCEKTVSLDEFMKVFQEMMMS